MMNISLEGKRALVGGASSGIGKAIAIELANCGAEVVLMSRSEDKLVSALAELCANKGQKHSYLVTDFNDYERHRSIIEAFFEDNQIDILVNNTNGPLAGGIMSKTANDYQQAFDLLFRHAVQASLLTIESMKKKGFGRIINVSSMTVKEPNANLVLSNTMRTALVSWSKSLASDVAKDGITVNTVLTGFFDTDRLNSLMQMEAEKTGVSFEQVKQGKSASIPVQRLGEPREYGYMVAFLASEYASFLTGTAVPLDGGAATAMY
ncbi:SDR family oxidoreductase [Sphingobacterium sp. UT-1RO-CII-1]|uniref:SDR family oxidoreductase n=1 Tax=Sphingobacterium sp. UT-1RO-CII-1 TaxID=2995225 RepID=UPI00227A2D8B|nr:SDR family oxidoreductase [Sphingobacterium sp. UT-1RO-CII-1]MCY4780573.1 SDR family oxidoreductase [Sphingobacterium sp. UT-1RO-CII-1]